MWKSLWKAWVAKYCLRPVSAPLTKIWRFNKIFRSSHWRCSIKKVLQTFSQNSEESTCARVSFLINLEAWAYNLKHAKRGSGASVFLWVLRNFSEHFLYRTPLGNCFWIFSSVARKYHVPFRVKFLFLLET